ncbi:MAG: SET domain-containing protein [Bacteroidota bacterium]
MALLEKHLVVKPSTIPGSGKGLFTKKFIPKNTRILQYKGRVTIWKEVKNDNNNGYIYTINNNHVIDAKNTLTALARYANDARGLIKIKGITNNCDYVNDGLKAFIESKRDIEANEEILVAYGKEYWDVIKENLRKEEQKQKALERKAKVKRTAAKK